MNPSPHSAAQASALQEVVIEASGVELFGNLSLPTPRQGLVLFVHGSGSSRFSPRNRQVASLLGEAGLATLLFDLLTPDEEMIDQQDRSLRFAIPWLSERLLGVLDWVAAQPDLAELPLGLFGASTGAAAALSAAAARSGFVKAVVSRGGRPDLAPKALSAVTCPTLFIVGGQDLEVLRLNRLAAARLRCAHALQVIPGASHLFEEPGALEQVATLARDWFLNTLPANPA